eukprot:CAMPEP_0175067310 /NCGR_PEP_ID=MMETSP0052_2-20121109/17024_1 /TAXON_ID=51329 ORGANISM="Polytomella parva, Strain SAG 63-3" /NCGR_SAMPLE_ID=MMETSP0052_2 /ASSEMBLY_ACC=CAM_ASM_000194 /LENGTH=42 /DNA_ID= /DNA_START= /DNA_END= /DNA_ORIENTATION=
MAWAPGDRVEEEEKKEEEEEDAAAADLGVFNRLAGVAGGAGG